jgi:hypothetical protein
VDSETSLVNIINGAFRNVALGKGIGLREADGLDSYASKDELLRLRSTDEKTEWSRITAEDLNTYDCSLAHFDTDGMRFHLPAYLIAEINGQLYQDIVFH